MIVEKNRQVLVNDGFFEDFYLCLCSRTELCPGQCTGPAVRFHYTMFYSCSGNGTVCMGKSKVPLSADEGVFIPPNRTISLQAGPQKAWDCIQVGFSGQKADECLAAMKLEILEQPFTCTQAEKLEALTDKMLASPRGTMEQVLFRQFLLCSVLSVLAQKKSDGKNTESEEKKNFYVAEAVRYISDHYAEPMLVGTIAARLGISRNYFFLLFKQSMGCSPSAYIINFRLERAGELLRQTEYSVDYIALSCGYQDPAVFSRAFKKKYGRTPSQYRKA